MRDDCNFLGKDGWCELKFHEPEELKRMCPICKDYEPKEKDKGKKYENRMYTTRKN